MVFGSFVGLLSRGLGCWSSFSIVEAFDLLYKPILEETFENFAKISGYSSNLLAKYILDSVVRVYNHHPWLPFLVALAP